MKEGTAENGERQETGKETVAHPILEYARIKRARPTMRSLSLPLSLFLSLSDKITLKQINYNSTLDLGKMVVQDCEQKRAEYSRNLHYKTVAAAMQLRVKHKYGLHLAFISRAPDLVRSHCFAGIGILE